MDAALNTVRDALGPAKVVLLHDPAAHLDAVVVVDNLAAGAAIGGVRLATDITVTEVARLARAMTLKNLLAGLPHGGGKAGIVGDPEMRPAAKQPLLRAFARAIASLDEYIPGPDMGTDETCMAWIHDEIGRAVGLPEVLGGIPLDKFGATGLGLAASAEAAEEAGYLGLRGARVAVQGFGAVGRHAARFLAERGAVLIAASDSRGATVNRDGLDPERLAAFAATGAPVADFPAGTSIPRDELLWLECDILLPAARPDVLTAETAPLVAARVVLEGANIPATRDAEELLQSRGILCIPDVVANAGGVICASVEYRGGTRMQAFALIQERLRANTIEVLIAAKEAGITPRDAAEAIASERLAEAQRYRRAFPASP
jgi:glutamate dehydrogenase (NAD(P)+)